MIVLLEDEDTTLGRIINRHNRMEFTLKHLKRDLQLEIEKFDINKWEPGQRGARITAAIKQCKTHYMLDYVLYEVLKKNGDMNIVFTPLMARRLCKALFGRTCSQSMLVGYFGGRLTSKATDEQHAMVDVFIEQHQPSSVIYWQKIEHEIKKAVDGYRKNISNAQKQKG
jgi:hypothetical protein